MREGRKGGNTEDKESDPEGQHGGGPHPRRKRDPTEEPIAQLSAHECAGRCGGQPGADRAHHPQRDELDGGRGEGDGCGDEGHEPGEDFRPDGQVRVAVRGSGRAELVHGEHYVADDDDGRAPERRGVADAASCGRGWVCWA